MLRQTLFKYQLPHLYQDQGDDGNCKAIQQQRLIVAAAKSIFQAFCRSQLQYDAPCCSQRVHNAIHHIAPLTQAHSRCERSEQRLGLSMLVARLRLLTNVKLAWD
jgi:hypothetical protein